MPNTPSALPIAGTLDRSPAELARLLRRTARRLDERAEFFARPVPFGLHSLQRTMRRRASSYAADAQALRALADAVAASSPAGASRAATASDAAIAAVRGDRRRGAP